MFKKSYNRAVLRIRFETVTPLLIRGGESGLDPTLSDMACVRTRVARLSEGQHLGKMTGPGERTVYLPGSSLKGTFRSAVEVALRGRTIQGVDGACNPLDRVHSCGQQLQRDANKKQSPRPPIHAKHCLACRVFGSTAMRGRAAIRDCFPFQPEGEGDSAAGGTNHQRANRLDLRYGVNIDRLLGSVRHGPFDQEQIPPGVSFWGEIALQNYQLWQLGVLARAMDEANAGFVQLGASQSRGLGVIKVEVLEITHEQIARGSDVPLGVGNLVARAEERSEFGLLEEEGVLSTEGGTVRGMSLRFQVQGAACQGWLENARRAMEALG